MLRTLEKSKKEDADGTFENSIIEIQQKKLELEEKTLAHSCKSEKLDFKLKIMREVKQLQRVLFSDEEIMSITPESKPMFEKELQFCCLKKINVILDFFLIGFIFMIVAKPTLAHIVLGFF